MSTQPVRSSGGGHMDKKYPIPLLVLGVWGRRRCRTSHSSDCWAVLHSHAYPHFPFFPANARTWIWVCAWDMGFELQARSFVITLGISFQRGGGKGGEQGNELPSLLSRGLGFFFGCRWQSMWKSLSYIHYWRFYSLMNVTHLRNRIVFQYSRCSVEHLWLVISHLNISCKHQKLFVCFNVPSHPITQWRWKIEMQRCLAKRFFFPSFLPLFPLMYLCLVSN